MDDGALEPLVRWWRAQDDLFANAEPRWWGAVVSDARYPDVQEANYARLEALEPVRLSEVEEPLLPAMAKTARGRSHVVVFHPEEQTDLLVEASTRGDGLTWDLVMEHRGVPPTADTEVEAIAFDDAFAPAHRNAMAAFGIVDDGVVEQLRALEREVMLPAGRRWFAIRDAHGVATVAALLVLEGVGYLDQVVTFPRARRRGFATAIASHALAEARSLGAERTFLLAEPDGEAARLYGRVGFRAVTQIASWISPPRSSG